jgi:hypothetical protein
MVLIFGHGGLVTIDLAFVSYFTSGNFGVGTHLSFVLKISKNMFGLILVFCSVSNVLLWGCQR